MTSTQMIRCYRSTFKFLEESVFFMTNKKFTAAAIIAAAITAAPMLATGVSTFTATPVMAAAGSSDVNHAPGTFVVNVAKANVRSSQGGLIGKTLKKGTKWHVFGAAFFLGQTYYDLGGDQYVASSTGRFYGIGNAPYVKKTSKIKVSNVKHYSAQVYNGSMKAVKDAKGNLKKLKYGTSWKTFGSQEFHGEIFYNVGGNQWVDSQSVKVTK